MRSIAFALLTLAACSRPAAQQAAPDLQSPLPSASASASVSVAPVIPSVAAAPSAPEPVGARRVTVPAAFRGVFHLKTAGTLALNLQILADGTYFWRHDDCICAGGGRGLWSVSGAAVVLAPREQPPAPEWAPVHTGLPWEPANVSDAGKILSNQPATKDASRVVLTPSGGGLDVVITWASGGTEQQRWNAGQVCPVCRGGFSPGPLPAGKPAEACNNPDYLTPMDWNGSMACH